jgi:hypothetical protein
MLDWGCGRFTGREDSSAGGAIAVDTSPATTALEYTASTTKLE